MAVLRQISGGQNRKVRTERGTATEARASRWGTCTSAELSGAKDPDTDGAHKDMRNETDKSTVKLTSSWTANGAMGDCSGPCDGANCHTEGVGGA